MSFLFGTMKITVSRATEETGGLKLSFIADAIEDGRASSATNARGTRDVFTGLARSSGTASATRAGAAFSATRISTTAPITSRARTAASVTTRARARTRAVVSPDSRARIARPCWTGALLTRTRAATEDNAGTRAADTLATAPKASKEVTAKP